MKTGTASVVDLIRDEAIPLTGLADEYEPLIDMIGDARLVLMGEATHGTHEFYFLRAELTRLLVEEKGFNAVAIEADWSDAYRVNRFVRAIGKDRQPEQALGDFKRFPRWMWRNQDVLNFVRWLRQHNAQHSQRDRCGFYGVDLYSLYRSIELVIEYLENIDPEAARRARDRYACFGRFGGDPQRYGYTAVLGLNQSCEDEAVQQLLDLRRNLHEYAQRDEYTAQDEAFFAEQNARLAQNAEKYYRAMFGSHIDSWNVRDRHMAQTIDALVQHLDNVVPPAKIVVWEHNSHIGDARATGMGEGGELNVGQLVRESYGDDSVLIGFSTYTGTVAAASDWGGDVELEQVRPALPESYEALLHEAQMPRFTLNLRDRPVLHEALRQPRLQRAIGVVYRPQTERASHYFDARLSEQFDALVHFDQTRAVEPLDRTAGWSRPDLPETYPTGY